VHEFKKSHVSYSTLSQTLLKFEKPIHLPLAHLLVHNINQQNIFFNSFIEIYHFKKKNMLTEVELKGSLHDIFWSALGTNQHPMQ